MFSPLLQTKATCTETKVTSTSIFACRVLLTYTLAKTFVNILADTVYSFERVFIRVRIYNASTFVEKQMHKNVPL